MSRMKRASVVGALVAAVLVASYAPVGPVRTDDARGIPAPTSQHLVVIAMENKSFAQIFGNTHAPYINGTLIPQGRLYTRFYAAMRPSLPNYLVLAAGDSRGCVIDGCPRNSIPGENIFHMLDVKLAGTGTPAWKVYAESMPRNCYLANSGAYVARHNPAVYFTNLNAAVGNGSCARQDVPFTQLAADIAAGALPPFAFIAPNLYNDMHTDQKQAPCLTGDTLQNQICQGDRWLSQNVPAILGNGGRNDVTVLLWFDEGVNGQGGGGHVMLVEVGAGVPAGTTVDTPTNTYGLANAIADWFDAPHQHPAQPPIGR